MCGLVTTSLDTARNNTLFCSRTCFCQTWGTATSTSTTETETHVCPAYLATKHWVTFLRRGTELAAVEGRFQVYHTKLSTPSSMFVLDTFLPGIGASLIKPHVTRYGACPTIMKICVMVGHPLFSWPVSHRIVRRKELIQRTQHESLAIKWTDAVRSRKA